MDVYPHEVESGEGWLFTWTPSGLMAMKLEKESVNGFIGTLEVMAAYVCSLEDILMCM